MRARISILQIPVGEEESFVHCELCDREIGAKAMEDDRQTKVHKHRKQGKDDCSQLLERDKSVSTGNQFQKAPERSNPR